MPNPALNQNNRPERTAETEQYILNLSFDKLHEILMTGLLAYNATTEQYDRIQINPATGELRTGAIALATRVDDTSPPITYVGKAVPGTATSSATWQIQKIDESSGVITTWADGNSNYDNVWDLRSSLVYS